MKMHELDSYLGDFANDLDANQKRRLIAISDRIEQRYAQLGDLDEFKDEYHAAFMAATLYVMGDLGTDDPVQVLRALGHYTPESPAESAATFQVDLLLMEDETSPGPVCSVS